MFPQSADLSGIDLDFRPHSYFPVFADISLGVTGGAGVPPRPGGRRPVAFYRAPPLLRNTKQEEVKIARIELPRAPGDIVTVCAQRKGDRAVCRIFDMRDQLAEAGRGTHVAGQPMTLGELGLFLTSTGGLRERLRGLAEGSDVEDLRDFSRGTSHLYPQFGELMQRLIDAWVQEWWTTDRAEAEELPA